jgi:hypothetical protein
MTAVPAAISGYMVVFAIVEKGLLGFGLHALNVQPQSACKETGDRIVQEVKAENACVLRLLQRGEHRSAHRPNYRRFGERRH